LSSLEDHDGAITVSKWEVGSCGERGRPFACRRGDLGAIRPCHLWSSSPEGAMHSVVSRWTWKSHGLRG